MKKSYKVDILQGFEYTSKFGIIGKLLIRTFFVYIISEERKRSCDFGSPVTWFLCKYQTWTNCRCRSGVLELAKSLFSGAHVCLLKKKNSFDIKISRQVNKTMKKLQKILNTIVSTSILVLFSIFPCFYIWWCQNSFIYSRIEKYLINCLH